MIGKDSVRGVLVAVEGMDRSVAATQANLLGRALGDMGFGVLHMRFPDRTSATGAAIDRHLRGVEVLPNERAHALLTENLRESEPAVRLAIAAGKIVIVERYAHSGVAYGAAAGLSPVECAKREEGLPHPDVVIFVDSGTLGRRDAEVYDTPEFRAAARREFSRMMDSSWFVVDGSIEAHARILERVLECVRSVDDHDGPLASF
jgi:dTMP kinase